MKTYSVALYFGQSTVSPLVEPSKVVEVEVAEYTPRNDVIKSALSIIGIYPKTYSAQVTLAN